MKEDNRWKDVDAKLKGFIDTLAEGHTQMSELLKGQHKETRMIITTESQGIRTHIDRTFKGMQISDSNEVQHQRLLASLKYPGMNERWNAVSETHHDTFEWIFDEKIGHQWDSFLHFLETDGQFPYWICGKPGSGKSTLMKFICEHPRTKEALGKWKPGSEPIILSYFIWKPGHINQRNLKGLLYHLLHQLVDYDSSLSPKLMMEFPWLEKKAEFADWSQKDLQNVLLRGLEVSSRSVCIFIDGLDEFDHEEGHWALLGFISKLSSVPVKMCVSSRPEILFQRKFAANPQLKLQDLTARDIEKVANDRLVSCLPELRRRPTEDEMLDLVRLVAKKAEGVFLWVTYALTSLSKGLTDDDDWHELRKRLEVCPNTIEDLYRQMWDRLNEDKDIYRQEAARYFKLVLNRSTWKFLKSTILSLTLAHDHNAQRRILDEEIILTDSELVEKCETMFHRLASRCAGLLEVISPSGKRLLDLPSGPEKLEAYDRMRVQFIHRTARDFLMDKNDGQMILSHHNEPKDHYITAWVRASMAYFLISGHKLDIYFVQYEIEHILAMENLGLQSALFDQLIRTCQRCRMVEIAEGEYGNKTYIDKWKYEFDNPGDLKRDFLGLAASMMAIYPLQDFFEAAKRQQRKVASSY